MTSRIHTLATGFFVFAAMGVVGTANAYDNAGQCSDAVVDSCNGKYEAGDALDSCVLSGVNQCIAAYPDNNNSNDGGVPQIGKFKSPTNSQSRPGARTNRLAKPEGSKRAGLLLPAVQKAR